uniref:DNA topoisomerase n=1 Tax=viral metagenome TaxID=1070528 RepID=A0A6C0JY39_9ZZZZ
MPPKFYRKKTTTKTKSSTDYSHIQGQHNDAIYLVIVESPSKCAKIESYLGSNYRCIASKGHIRAIDGIKNIDTKNGYTIKFSIIDEKKDHITFMRNCISGFSKQNIILATDDDREGEGIAWHICDLFDLPIETTKRIVFHEITKPALLKAIQNPVFLNMDLVRAQHARQVLDILVGYKVSPFLWKHIHNNKTNGLSAGRCQTPALRLVYENDRLVSGGDIETKYKTTGWFFGKNIPFHLNKDYLNTSEIREFLELSKTFSHTLSIAKSKESIRKPPKPFNTSALLQTASNVLHMSPKETMQFCQQLYQAGHITYMRTENTKYSADFLPKVRDYILQKWEHETYLGDFENIVNKDETNPHEAIRVTHIEYPFIAGLEGRLHTLYKLIWRNTVESCMAPAKYNCTTVSISSPKDACYTNIVEVPVFLGWKIVVERDQGPGAGTGTEGVLEEQNCGAGLLFFFQSINPKTPVVYNKIDSIITVSHRHSHYTESSLIQKLEDLGIGRPSTFATIVDTIQERGYVKKQDVDGIKINCTEFVLREHTLEETTKSKTFGQEKNKLVLQPIGLATLEFLVDHFQPLFNYDYTKQMEEDLEKVSVADWQTICEKCENLIKTLAKPVSKMAKPVYLVSSLDGSVQYELCFHQYGTSLKRITETGETEYKKVNPKIKIDIELAKAGKYIAEELFEIQNDNLGKYGDEDIILKNGKYGPYIQCGTKTISIKSLGKPIQQVTLEDAIVLLDPSVSVNECGDGSAPRAPPAPKNPNILRILNSDISIRKGKYGAYIYYMPADAKKPEFFQLGKMKTKYANMDVDELIKWIGETYNVCVSYQNK